MAKFKKGSRRRIRRPLSVSERIESEAYGLYLDRKAGIEVPIPVYQERIDRKEN